MTTSYPIQRHSSFFSLPAAIQHRLIDIRFNSHQSHTWIVKCWRPQTQTYWEKFRIQCFFRLRGAFYMAGGPPNTAYSRLFSRGRAYNCSRSRIGYILLIIIIIIIIIIITRTMFMVISSWLRVIARVHPVHAMNAEQRQAATHLWTKPTDLSRRPACGLLGNHIHHRHLLLLSPKADTHFTIPQRVEVWVDL